jgi:tetraacyldisaccharide 4'-kinase
VVDSHSEVKEVGDEALQVYKKFPDIVVAVNESRVSGVKKILNHFPQTNLVVIDDCFQHRYLRPGLNLMLTHYSLMFYDDFLLPAGRLREYKSGVKRADAVIVTHTPPVFSPLDKKLVMGNIRRYFNGRVFFSTIDYGEFVPLDLTRKCFPKRLKNIILFTGIANTVSIENYLNSLCISVTVMKFPDHYFFREKDLMGLKKTYLDTYGHSKVIVVTEKDSVRLQDKRLAAVLKGLPVYCLPVEVRFHGSDEESFNKLVLGFLEGRK